uniref:DUF8040 domain-containing protein n=1 Tax=Aegilops tauschii TaxID=37682 RepID=N1QPM9_AEGTA
MSPPTSKLVLDEGTKLLVQTASLIALVQAWILLVHKRAVHQNESPRIQYVPMLIWDQERIGNLNYIYSCNDTEALWMLRMKRAPFSRLVQTFRSRWLLEDSTHTTVEDQLAMFLYVVGHNQRFRIVHNTFRRSMETIH